MENPGTERESPTAKDGLRARLLARRKALAPRAAAESGARVVERIRALPAFSSAAEVLTYMPVQGEVDVTPLLAELWARGARVLLPRCRPGEPGAMDVACVTCMEDMRPGMYGIAEPAPGTCAALADAAPDLVLVPAVAYDRRGYRLGFGAGFYDRFFSRGGARGALLAGPCYDFQLQDALPRDSWDIPVNVVITENETLWT